MKSVAPSPGIAMRRSIGTKESSVRVSSTSTGSRAASRLATIWVTSSTMSFSSTPPMPSAPGSRPPCPASRTTSGGCDARGRAGVRRFAFGVGGCGSPAGAGASGAAGAVATARRADGAEGASLGGGAGGSDGAGGSMAAAVGAGAGAGAGGSMAAAVGAGAGRCAAQVDVDARGGVGPAGDPVGRRLRGRRQVESHSRRLVLRHVDPVEHGRGQRGRRHRQHHRHRDPHAHILRSTPGPRPVSSERGTTEPSRRNFPSRRGVAIQPPGIPEAARSASNGCAQAQGGSHMKLGTLVIGVALLLGTAGSGFAGTVNCKQVNKYLGTGRSVSDVAQTMVIDEADVKKCQEEAAKGTAGGAKDAAKPAAEAPSKDMPK